VGQTIVNEFLFILLLLGGAGLFAWGVGWDRPLATLVGIALLALSVLATLRVRLTPGLLASVSAAVLLVAGIVLVARPFLTTEPPAPAVQVPGTPAAPAPSPGGTPAAGGDLAAQGQQIASANQCFACHTTTGQRLVGPSWKGLFGKTEQLQGGGTVQVDEAYIRESIRNPGAKIVQGYQPLMPQLNLSDEQIDAIIAYIKTLQ